MVDGFAGLRLPRAPVYGKRGVVVSGHPLASMAGLRILEDGGSVADAMIATSAVLCAVIPHATSLGGDAFILYHDGKTRKTSGLNASGPAPRRATPEAFPNGMVGRGPLAATVPGIVRGWEELHRRHGRMGWGGLFAQAIEIAEDGHPMSRVLAGALRLFRADIEADPGCAALYYPGGKPRERAEVIRQPALAETLERIARDGSGAFYEGPIAQSIGEASAARGGLLAAEDFAGYAPEWVEPIETGYRGLRVQVMPPNSWGILMLLQLNALAGLPEDVFTGEDATRLDYLILAKQAAFAEGIPYIADPRIHPAPLADLLGAATTARLRDAVANRTAPKAAVGRGGTSCIAIADGEGNGMTVVQSVFHVFGSAFLDPGTGILLNNRMLGFSTDKTHRNVVAPGKRPAHTLNPVVVLAGDGALKYLMASPGAAAQTVTNIQILTNLVHRGMELSQAVEAPRWSITQSGDPLLEEEFPDAVLARLSSAGHAVGRAQGASQVGSAKCIERLPNGVLAGAADARREAYACGF